MQHRHANKLFQEACETRLRPSPGLPRNPGLCPGRALGECGEWAFVRFSRGPGDVSPAAARPAPRPAPLRPASGVPPLAGPCRLRPRSRSVSRSLRDRADHRRTVFLLSIQGGRGPGTSNVATLPGAGEPQQATRFRRSASVLPGLAAQRGTWKCVKRKDCCWTRGFITATLALQIKPAGLWMAGELLGTLGAWLQVQPPFFLLKRGWRRVTFPWQLRGPLSLHTWVGGRGDTQEGKNGGSESGVLPEGSLPLGW